MKIILFIIYFTYSINLIAKENWGYCTKGPYNIFITAIASISRDITLCFSDQDILNTNNLDEAKKTYYKYNNIVGTYKHFKNFYGNEKLKNYCTGKFVLPIKIKNFAVRVHGYNEFDSLETCAIKHLY